MADDLYSPPVTPDLDPDQVTPVPASPSRRPARGCLIEIVETLVLTLIIFWVIQTFVAQPFRVQQESMQHTLEPDQYVLVDKLTPRWDHYKRGDVVVFEPPDTWIDSKGEPFIKRVIGIGGDTVEIRDGVGVRERDAAHRALRLPGEWRRPRRPNHRTGSTAG